MKHNTATLLFCLLFGVTTVWVGLYDLSKERALMNPGSRVLLVKENIVLRIDSITEDNSYFFLSNNKVYAPDRLRLIEPAAIKLYEHHRAESMLMYFSSLAVMTGIYFYLVMKSINPK